MSTTTPLTTAERVYAALAGGDSHHDDLLACAHVAKPVPGDLTERDLDLLDYGVAVGVAFALVRTAEPLQRPGDAIRLALDAAGEAVAGFIGDPLEVK